MPDHKTNLNKFKELKIIQGVFSDHNEMKLEINNRKKFGTLTNTWKLNNKLLNNQWVKEESKEKLENS